LANTTGIGRSKIRCRLIYITSQTKFRAKLPGIGFNYVLVKKTGTYITIKA